MQSREVGCEVNLIRALYQFRLIEEADFVNGGLSRIV